MAKKKKEVEQVEHVPGTYDPEIHDPLAERVLEIYGQNPRLTINLVASSLDAHYLDVTYVLDAYEVVDGVPTHGGPGQGGGWVPPELQPEEITIKSMDIGSRWPDGSLRDIPFDIDNPAHLEEMERDSS